jgi:hypothetical protein
MNLDAADLDGDRVRPVVAGAVCVAVCAAVPTPLTHTT